jgi:uncharacterized BrkB/YihY/UPF0761 family membrane protein
VLRARLGAAVRALVATARSSQLSFLAASLAYFMVLALVPLGLLAFVGASVAGGEGFGTRLIESVGGTLSPEAAALLGVATRSQAALGGATAMGVFLLGWSGLRLFRGLGVAFATIDGVDPGSLRSQLRDGLVALVAVGGAIVTVTVLSTVVVLGTLPFARITGILTLLAALTVVFLPLYYVLPVAEMSVRTALPGALTAAIGWTILGGTFAMYAAVTASSAVFAVLGGLVLVLAWCYVASLVLLAGATVNATLRGDREDRHSLGTAGPIPDTMGDEGDPETDLAALREDVAEVRADLEERSDAKAELERDLRRYVRRRVRRGHARGWGPYLVLAYGTAMTLGALYFLSGGWAILAMVVVWLSTLGLYVLMVVVGVGVGVLGIPGRVRDVLGRLR